MRLVPVATGLDSPTNLAFAPDGRAFFTEQQTGLVRILDHGRVLPSPLARFDVVPGSETGLLGIAVDPHFAARPWVYVYLSSAGAQRNELLRFRADDPANRQTLLRGLPLNGIHNGGDLAFGPDGALYLVVGEGGDPARAQDPQSVGGKVLRLRADGGVPADNPFGPDDPVYALGIRNSFGLCFDPHGRLWETENGPDADDEVNHIVAGANYGWPAHLGPGGAPSFTGPLLVFRDVIVPTGCAVAPPGESLYFGDYSGGRLHRAEISSSGALGPPRVVATAPSGITDVARAPDGELYVVTADAILRVVGRDVAAGGESTTGSPSPAPSRSSTGAASSGASSGRSLVVAALFAVLLIGLTARAVAGRRLRRASRGATPPDDPVDHSRGRFR